MKVLTINTTGSSSVVSYGEKVVSKETPGTYVEHLVPMMEEVIGGAQPELVVVALGPGSWNGVRVGTATAKIYAYAAGLPIVGILGGEELTPEILVERGVEKFEKDGGDDVLALVPRYPEGHEETLKSNHETI